MVLIMATTSMDKKKIIAKKVFDKLVESDGFICHVSKKDGYFWVDADTLFPLLQINDSGKTWDSTLLSVPFLLIGIQSKDMGVGDKISSISDSEIFDALDDYEQEVLEFFIAECERHYILLLAEKG